MDARRLLVHRVLVDGEPVARCARDAGVSRETAYKWIHRAREEGLALLSERSRRPHVSPSAVGSELVQELLELKAQYPSFGARKLSVLMEGRLKERTAARVLSRHGLTCPSAPKAPFIRFEGEQCNELWQMDFKGLRKRRVPYEVFSVIDDSSRFCLALDALPDQRLVGVWDTLWGAFEVYGLPEVILCDNGSAFRASATWRPSSLELRLMRLGVRCIHGRPYHPQTQGKVERFHGTLERDLGENLLQPSLRQAADVLSVFRQTYNWIRPHEAIEMKVPGAVYRSSNRERPATLPTPEHLPGAFIQTVKKNATISWRGTKYRLGQALVGQEVELIQTDLGWDVFYYGNPLGILADYKE